MKLEKEKQRLDEIENQIAVSVISDKGSISYNDVEE